MKWKSLISAALVLTGCAFDDALVHDPELRLMFQPEMYMHVSQEGTVRFPAGGAVPYVPGRMDRKVICLFPKLSVKKL